MIGKNLLLSGAALLALSATSYGQLIDVAYNWGGATPSGAAYLGSAGDQWNVYNAYGNGNQGPLALTDVSGNTTGVSMSFTSDGAVESLNTGSQPDPALTDYYLFNNTGGPITVSLSGLTANSAYDLVLYVASDDAVGDGRSLEASLTGQSSASYYATGNPEASFVNGQNMLNLSAVTDASGNLSLSLADGFDNTSGEVDLNGFQLTPTPAPEPATMTVLGIGVFTAWKRRKRA